MIKVALLGFGVVGSGCAEVLTQNKDLICAKVGDEVEIKYILDLRDFPDSPFADRVVHDFGIIVNDPEIAIVAEMMGGSHPAYDFTKACLEAGKSVVTSNKEVVANFGTELLALAEKHGVSYLFEASVGGGIPVLRSIYVDLASNRICEVNGILNGTTNYILTSMKQSGTSFGDALKKAQELGYAEANPAADVEGLDAARKTAILCGLCFGKLVAPANIHTEGITAITGEDVAAAAALGYAIKLIGHADSKDGKIQALVSPRLVSLCNPLSGISDVFNGVLLKGDMVGEVMFYGPGAGKLPTASAVVGDIIDVAHGVVGGSVKHPYFENATAEDTADFGDYSCARYFRFANTADEVTEVLGEHVQQMIAKDGYVAVITDAVSERRAVAMVADKLCVCSAMRVL